MLIAPELRSETLFDDSRPDALLVGISEIERRPARIVIVSVKNVTHLSRTFVDVDLEIPLRADRVARRWVTKGARRHAGQVCRDIARLLRYHSFDLISTDRGKGQRPEN